MRRGLLTGLFGALQVPFEQVPDLVASRRVLLRGGAAFVSRHEVASLVVGHFRAGLSHSLALTARRWAASIADEEAERLTPVVLSLSERCPRRRRTCQRANVHRGCSCWNDHIVILSVSTAISKHMCTSIVNQLLKTAPRILGCTKKMGGPLTLMELWHDLPASVD